MTGRGRGLLISGGGTGRANVTAYWVGIITETFKPVGRTVVTRTRRQFIGRASAAGAFGGSITAALDAAQSTSTTTMPTARAKALMGMFGLKYPIFEAPHGPRATGPDLAAAVSNAGAMGALALSAFTPDRAHDAVAKVRAATKGNFVVNYILAFSSGKEPPSLKSALDAGAPIVQFSWGMPTKETVSIVRSAGAKFGYASDQRGECKSGARSRGGVSRMSRYGG